jgi:hypothetical protein
MGVHKKNAGVASLIRKQSVGGERHEFSGCYQVVFVLSEEYTLRIIRLARSYKGLAKKPIFLADPLTLA